MAYDNAGALNGVESIVGVHSMLIFGEEGRIVYFPHIMIEGSGTHELHIGSDTVGGSRSEIAHRHGVLECAGTLFGEFAEQRIVDIRELHESDL